jgi:hypothetical protein
MPVIWVTEARALAPFRVWVRFSDGVEGEVDLGPVIASDPRPLVRALQSPALFASLRVEDDTVAWPNGFDLAPEFLYESTRAKARL